MKYLQILGNAIPVLLVAFAYYLFHDLEPNTPKYAGASVFLLWIGAAFFAISFVFLFIVPSSCILLKVENREYFGFKSVGWTSVLVINWLLIGFYSLCVLVYVLTS
ncbi:hypothetical protein [Shewanella mangrovisoli]|uniref:hypothetical protein n=1 Tax=Shewanella mangrovisoli TaxID=2864211 RepID=UPI00370C3FB3